MKRRTKHESIGIVAATFISALMMVTWMMGLCFAEEHPKIDLTKRMADIVHMHEKTVIEWVKDPVLIEAVKEQNRKKVSLNEIQRIDKEWIEGRAEAFAMSLQSNKSGLLLKKKLETNQLLYVEAFLCDDQGAVVGEYPKTSDYWQGDEEKFTLCYNNGHGKVYINPLMYDESTKTYSVQISIPVKDHDKTIGVLIVGLKNIR